MAPVYCPIPAASLFLSKHTRALSGKSVCLSGKSVSGKSDRVC